jgi:hypothetical protein
MKTVLRCFAIVLFTVGVSRAENPGESINPPSFLKVGSRFALVFVNGSEPERVYGEVKEFGPGTWMRIERMIDPGTADGRIRVRSLALPNQPPNEPVRLDIPPASWFNWSKLAAVVLQEKAGPVSEVPDGPGFPKVGTSYYLSSKFGPYFGKVLESSSE